LLLGSACNAHLSELSRGLDVWNRGGADILERYSLVRDKERDMERSYARDNHGVLIGRRNPAVEFPTIVRDGLHLSIAPAARAVDDRAGENAEAHIADISGKIPDSRCHEMRRLVGGSHDQR